MVLPHVHCNYLFPHRHTSVLVGQYRALATKDQKKSVLAITYYLKSPQHILICL